MDLMKYKEISRLEKRLKEYTNKVPKNVAIIGPPGVGKSSFINSVIASFSSESWRERTRVGYYDRGEQVTHHLIRITKDEYLDSEEQKGFPYPTLIDMDGFDNKSNNKIKEQLRYVLFGVVPPEHRIQETVDDHTNRVEGIAEAYKNTQEPLKVDRLIFVASVDSELPYNLIKAVNQVAVKEEREIPVFGVLTKQDKIINFEEGNSKKKDFCSKLGLPENRFLLCTNYCDDYDRLKGQSRCEHVYPELDVPILKFMTQVCDAGIKVTKDETEPKNSKSSKTVYVVVGVITVMAVGFAFFGIYKNR